MHEDRPYAHEEILRLLNVCDLRMKAVVLLLSSTGMRIGALPTLRVQDVTEQGKVTVYADTKDKYITFMTPECSKAVNDYLEYRHRCGEKITPNSYLIREQFDINDLEQIKRNSKQVNKGTISNIIRSNLVKVGLRIVNHTFDNRTRHTITLVDGFRKFFTNQLIEADLKTEYRWLLEGHNLKGNDNYYVRITEKKLYEEYQKAIDCLTINPENRLKRKVEKLEIKGRKFRHLLLNWKRSRKH